MACTGIGGIPVRLVADPMDAVRFTDIDAAALRARYLTRLGWTNLSVVPVRIPCH